MSTPKAKKDVEILGHSYIPEETTKWYSHSGKQFGSFLNKF